MMVTFENLYYNF